VGLRARDAAAAGIYVRGWPSAHRVNRYLTRLQHRTSTPARTPPILGRAWKEAGGMQEKVVYLTPEGKQRFMAELRELQTVRRHEVEDQIRRAKEFSDTVDNAEYDEAKTEQGFVEGRIQELERLLSAAKVIEEPTTKADYVRMGAHIKVVDAEGEEETYYLVGSHEADPRRGLVSNESPIGRALIGKRVGDEVTVVAPAGSFNLKILEIT